MMKNKVGEAVGGMVDRTQQLTRSIMGDLSHLVISPGNVDGGMSSIKEKSLGCIVKAGHTDIQEVIPYAGLPLKKGLILMDGPGYDAESMAGLAASGCQLVVFTTGRGNPIGFPGVPVIKVASTSKLNPDHVLAQLFYTMKSNGSRNKKTAI